MAHRDVSFLDFFSRELDFVSDFELGYSHFLHFEEMRATGSGVR